jgi:hypothetical protein
MIGAVAALLRVQAVTRSARPRRSVPANSGPNEMANPKKAAAHANAARCSNGSL